MPIRFDARVSAREGLRNVHRSTLVLKYRRIFEEMVRMCIVLTPCFLRCSGRVTLGEPAGTFVSAYRCGCVVPASFPADSNRCVLSHFLFQAAQGWGMYREGCSLGQALDDALDELTQVRYHAR